MWSLTAQGWDSVGFVKRRREMMLTADDIRNNCCDRNVAPSPLGDGKKAGIVERTS
jgi:hypothetical protein